MVSNSRSEIVKINKTSGVENANNIFLALIKVDLNDIDNNYANSNSNNNINYYNRSIKNDVLVDTFINITNFNSTTYSHLVVKEKADNESSLLLQVLRALCQKNNCRTTTQPNVGPYSYLPGLIGTQNFSSKYAAYAELSLILIIISLWILSIVLCLNKYSKLRSLHPMLTPYPRGPMHIEEIKIVENEQDTIIYKKKPGTFDRNTTRGLLSKETVIGNKKIQNGECIKESDKVKYIHSIRSSSEPKMITYRCMINRSFGGVSRNEDNPARRYRNFERNQTISSTIPTESGLFPNRNLIVHQPRMINRRSDTKNRRSLYARSRLKMKKPTIESSFKSQDIVVNDDDNLSKSKSFVSKSPDLLNPNWIPLPVQKSLLDMHYHLHQKPPLLQTSYISKSDSNIKQQKFMEKSKKMLSLPNSDDRAINL